MVAVFESVFRLCPAESVTENEGALLKAMVKVASVCLCLPLSVSVFRCRSVLLSVSTPRSQAARFVGPASCKSPSLTVLSCKHSHPITTHERGWTGEREREREVHGLTIREHAYTGGLCAQECVLQIFKAHG